MSSIIKEATNNFNHPLRIELKKICTVLFGYLEKGGIIPIQAVRFTSDKSRKLLQETTKERREYYESTSYTGFYPCDLKYAIEYYPVNTPSLKFRYIEEMLVVFSLMYKTIINDKETYPILYNEMRAVGEGLFGSVSLTPSMERLFVSGIKGFKEKYITKFSYLLGKKENKDIRKFIQTFFVKGLNSSRIILNIYALSYRYLMVDKRNHVVQDNCHKNRWYKFTFDSFYWSREAFEKVIKTKTPSPRR